MNVYLVETTLDFNYDCAEAFVVTARNEHAAKTLTMGKWGDHEDFSPDLFDTLTVELIGVAHSDDSSRVVLRSFNAG